MTMGWTSEPLEEDIIIFNIQYQYKSIFLSKNVIQSLQNLKLQNFRYLFESLSLICFYHEANFLSMGRC